MGAKNKVIAGDYEGNQVSTALGIVNISTGFWSAISVDKNTVENYEVMDEESRKSATSAVGRGLVGGLLLGPVGMLAGLSAKKKGVYIIALEFKDGKKSLLEVDDKIYKALLKRLF
ncbi:hypothetical protein M5X00_14625 [Paenibacillus alvei]|uniref:hypothetical protein n=1 Tax=Paenibacillus alvei TaxID=44250 RepID=UPI000288A469|nr:hypothetical protein [Paenibacillus alvei]EJW20009.1 hypothetical protein PAV_1c10040 [Paenibacillus alvei DSM 29]MCY9543404.1 hypothetical protein [Paenibacillus alvei]MCY9704716.1 hypothetical protein [Paenibacillus alvei]MCY9733731.1 hypothetical protein [Paenibacillus alvei]MCY9755478.1 hypothetical protein [Paenibacillus alvei]